MNLRYLFLLIAGLGLLNQLPAQETDTRTGQLNETLLESVIDENNSPDELEALLKELETIRQNPFDLNTVSGEELQKLPFLTLFQINSFLEYRKNKGGLISIYELKVIYGFTGEVVDQLLPFVTLAEETSGESRGLKTISGPASHLAVFRVQRILEKSDGYNTDPVTGSRHYPGNPWLLNIHYALKLKDHLRAGITMEKDPGEETFRTSNRNGFDFNSAFIMIENTGFLKTLIAGDYRLAFGQGLTLWNGSSPGKSSLVMNTAKRQDQVKAFTSNDENNFLRGIAGSATVKNLNFTLFFSVKKRDANITDTLDNRILFSSFQESGYHRTNAEITDEKSLNETVVGGNINFRNNFMKVGATLASYHFDKYREAGDDPEDKYDFYGDHLLNAGIDYALTLRKIQAFGELSYGNDDFATLHGVMMNVNKYASFSVLYRNFGRGYFAMNSSAFSERTDDTNEEGFYAGTVIHPVADLSISAYADFFSFPWLKYNTSAPSSGTDYLLQADYSPGKIKMFLRMKYGTDPEDVQDDLSPLPVLTEERNTSLRYHITVPLTGSMSMQSRLEWVRCKPEMSSSLHGIMVYQDFAWRLNSLPLEMDFRAAYFNTEGYSARIYAYEQDLTAGYSFSPLYDEGIRSYLMAVYSLKKSWTFGIRFSTTYMLDRDEQGSGADAIDLPYRNDIRIRISLSM